MPNCKSCHAPIRWVTMEATGKANPLDAVPVEGGNIEVHMVDGKEVGRVVGDEPGLFPAALYLSHFATCEQAADWRRR